MYIKKLKSNHIYPLNTIVLAIVFLLFFSKSYSQCTTPTAKDSSRCGIGSVTLGVSGGSKSLYNWYNTAVNGTLLGTGSLFNSPDITENDTFYVAQYDTGATQDILTFDGTNDYIAIENFNYSAAGNTAVTIECWIKTGIGTDHIIASYDRNRYWRLEVNGNGGGTGQIGFDLMTDAGQLDFGSSTRVDDNTWHHVAAVFDNGTVNLYIDGVLDATTTIGTTFGDGSTAYGFVGVGSEASVFDGPQGPTTYFIGEIDEFRIWSVARTATEIVDNKDKCITAGQFGLEVYYRMDGTAAVDSVIDFSLLGNNGQLKNFTLPGSWANTGTPLTDCPNCESARDTSFATINISPTPLIGNDTCSTSDVTLDAGPGFDSYLWNTGETTQTIVVDSTGFFYVTVDSTGTPCSTTDGVTVSILVKPSGTDTSRCGPGTVTLTATGGSEKYNWFNVPTGGTAIGQGTPWTSPVVNSTDTFYLASIENDTTDQAITFDGVNDYVSLNMSFNSNGALPTMTAEAWVKTTVSGGAYNSNWSILDFDRSDYFSFFVNGTDGTVGFSTTDNSGSIDDFYGPIANRVNDGAWHHAAVVYDGTDKKIYVDGTLVATKANAHGGLPLGTGTTRYGFIGDGSEATTENGTRNNLYFEGEIDEVRMWSDVRNILEIQENKDKCILGVEEDLLAYYKMENGAGSSILTDHSNSGNDGTLRNMNTTSAWINSGPYVTCSCGDSPRDTVVVEIKIVPTVNLGNDTCALAAVTLDAGAGMSSYLWQDGSSTQTISAAVSQEYSVIIDSVGTVCQGKDTIIVNVGKAADPTATDSTRCGSGIVTLKGTGQGQLRWYDSLVGGSLLGKGDSINVGPLTSDSTFFFAATLENTKALSFDGSDDYIAIKNYSYTGNANTEVTIEAWIRIPAASTGDHIIASYDRSEFWRFGVNGDDGAAGELGFGITTNSGVLSITSSATVNDGNWHHVAAVFDNGTATLYIDGAADGTGSLGTTFGKTDSTRFGFLGNGSEAFTENGTQGPDFFFLGEMDEVRIWSSARSQANIDLYKDSCLVGNEANLEVYYRMSEGSGSSLNDFSGNSQGIVAGPSWSTEGKAFICSPCSESDRIPIVAKIYSSISSTSNNSSCPGESGSVLSLSSSGGSGKYDYKELNGIFSYGGSYSADTVLKTVPNGGSYSVEVKDENNCLDTITGISTTPTPNISTIASGSASQSCLIPNTSGWFYLTNASNQALLAIDGQGSNLGNVSATVYVDGNASIINNDAYMGRHFVITPEYQPTAGAKVRLYFKDAEYTNLVSKAASTDSTDDNITSINDLGITKYNGPTEDGVFNDSDATSVIYIAQSSNGTQFGQKYIEFTTPGFSEVWIHASGEGDPLPVEMLSFNVTLIDDNTILNWSTASEINSAYFIIERSVDGIHFEVIGKVAASGNSTTVKNYSFTDPFPKEGVNYYRLKQQDYDYSFNYTDIIKIKINSKTNQSINIYPNPTNGNFFVSAQVNGTNEFIDVSLSDITGRSFIYRQQQSDSDGNVNFKINHAGFLAKGQYLLKLSYSGQVLTKIIFIN